MENSPDHPTHSSRGDRSATTAWQVLWLGSHRRGVQHNKGTVGSDYAQLECCFNSDGKPRRPKGKDSTWRELVLILGASCRDEAWTSMAIVCLTDRWPPAERLILSAFGRCKAQGGNAFILWQCLCSCFLWPLRSSKTRAWMLLQPLSGFFWLCFFTIRNDMCPFECEDVPRGRSCRYK